MPIPTLQGNPTNAAVWEGGNVYVAFTADTPTPAVPADIESFLGSDWHALGVLNGSVGVSETANQTVTKHHGWGFGVIKETEKEHEVVIDFTAREDNPTVRRLSYPATASGAPAGTVRFGPAEPAFIAVEFMEGAKAKRFISRAASTVRRNGATQRNEDNLEEVPFQATILPDADGHWIIQETGVSSS